MGFISNYVKITGTEYLIPLPIIFWVVSLVVEFDDEQWLRMLGYHPIDPPIGD